MEINPFIQYLLQILLIYSAKLKPIEVMHKAWRCASAIKHGHYEWIRMYRKQRQKIAPKLFRLMQPTISQYNGKYLVRPIKLD